MGRCFKVVEQAHLGMANRSASVAPSMNQGRLVVRQRLSITGPATPKHAAVNLMGSGEASVPP